MDQQLRIYTVQDRALDEFVSTWRRIVVPLRLAAGFEIMAAWMSPERSEFIWIVGCHEAGEFDRREKAGLPASM